MRFWGSSNHIKQRIHLRDYPEAEYREKLGMKSRAVLIALRKLVWECLKNICGGEKHRS